jgi:serine/threonine-protein kinase RsbW
VAVVGSGVHAGTSTPGEGKRTVLVQVGASAPELPPLRLVAAGLAARADFDLDAVEDLRLAVNEAASELVAVATPDSVLTCTFCLDGAQMEVTSSVPTRPGAILLQDSFGWRVLTTLVDDVWVTAQPDSVTPVMSITLRKRRSDKTVTERQ